MPTFSSEAIARFEDVLRKDPNSQVFAPLAEAYRHEQRWLEAERIASDGVRRHPAFAGGWVVLGKVQRDMKRFREATESLRKAVTLSPENLLAMQLLAESLVELKEPKEALKVYKRVLFLNPNAEKAKRIVAKLESLTADEYDDDIFAMTKLKPLEEKKAEAPAPVKAEPVKPGEPSKGLLRMLSLVDAFIVRNEIHRASQLLDETRVEFGDDALIQQRQLLLQRRRASMLGTQSEVAQPLAPLASREEQIRQKKVQTLRALLRRIEQSALGPLTS